MDKNHPETSTAGPQHPARYVFTWRDEGLTRDAKTIDGMIAALENAADALRMLKEAGVALDARTTGGDDARLVTTDPAVALRFGFDRENLGEEEATEAKEEPEDSPKDADGPR